jgi:hypothetical protein
LPDATRIIPPGDGGVADVGTTCGAMPAAAYSSKIFRDGDERVDVPKVHH